jgi:hypothetical protein
MAMVQYALWNDCKNACKFCLLKERVFTSTEQKIDLLRQTRENIDLIDWNAFPDGISLLGGEIYDQTDATLQAAFYDLIDVIIEKVLTKPQARYSTVSNCMYDPEVMLFPTVDKIASKVNIAVVDFNASYDLLYRYSSEEDRLRVIDVVNRFSERYNYAVGVQMILTQHVIDLFASGKSLGDLQRGFNEKTILTFLYPHPVHRGSKEPLPNFRFSRSSFLSWAYDFKHSYPTQWKNFYLSCINSEGFKFSGLYDKASGDTTQPPLLCGGKELKNPDCGHSTLYECYSDTDDECMLCDILEIGI